MLEWRSLAVKALAEVSILKYVTYFVLKMSRYSRSEPRLLVPTISPPRYSSPSTTETLTSPLPSLPTFACLRNPYIITRLTHLTTKIPSSFTTPYSSTYCKNVFAPTSTHQSSSIKVFCHSLLLKYPR